jgi:curved DNA-binding protein CbpA
MRNFMDVHHAFEILEIEENASLPEIKKAYRDLTQVWHPDRYTGKPRLYEKALEKMKEINAAYDCIVSFLEQKAKTSQDTHTASPAEDEYAFLTCPKCQAINRVPKGYRINIKIRCGRCGFSIHKRDSESREADWSQRTLCGDGDCIGVIGPSGRCSICGKTYFEGKKSDEYKANLRNEEFQQRIRKERKRKIRRYSFMGLGILAFIALVFVLDRSGNIAPEKPGQVPTFPKRIMAPDLPPRTRTNIQTERPEVSVNRGLPNGTMIRNEILNGNGKLTIKNGLDRDAAAKVIDKRKDVCIAYFYIETKSNSTLNGIGDGDYRLLFVTGLDWDQRQECFTREVAFSEFDRTMLYETREQIRGEEIFQKHTIIEVTLHRVAGGNVKTSKISSDDFNKY